MDVVVINLLQTLKGVYNIWLSRGIQANTKHGGYDGGYDFLRARRRMPRNIWT